MMAGRHSESEQRFTEYLAGKRRPSDAVWRLKARVAADVRGLTGDRQVRRPTEAAELIFRRETRRPGPGRRALHRVTSPS
jgi:hypothetical protein